jgi:predicted HTH transcriptional regulator
MAESIESVLREFTKRIEAIVRQQVNREVAAQVSDALASAASSVVGSLGGNGRRGRRTAKPAARATNAGGRRSPEEIERQLAKLVAHIKANPDQRSEQISEATAIDSADLPLLLKKLVADKKVKRKGVARGTTYALS